MIRNIELTNFKCFEQVALRVRPLTIVAGGNAAGKSSVIQALLLLRQSAAGRESVDTLRLDDKLVNLVSSEQAWFAGSDTANVRITVCDDTLEEDFFAEIPDASQADKQPACVTSDNITDALRRAPLFDGGFLYLNANRLTPQPEYLKGNTDPNDSRLGDRTGHRTVFRLQEALDNNEEVKIEALKRDGKSGVPANVNAWTSYIMGSSVAVNADGNPSGGKATLTFNTPSSGPVSALNMAFGNTYILPIILGVLTAEPGSLTIVENPEAHLHPKAQLRMGEFLATAAQGGAQILIETHSDHLLNGVRVAAKKRIIEPENVAIHFIEDTDGDHTATEISLRADGSLDKWPAGFFDEWENALRDIIF